MASRSCDWEIFGKILCILLLLLQGGVLDYYLAVKSSSSYLGFIATDIVVLGIWITVVFIAKAHCNIWMRLRHPCPKFKLFWKRRENLEDVDGSSNSRKDYPDELPYAFIAWFAYAAVTLVPEVAVIFNNYADKLEDVKIFHQNILKIALCITPILFLLLVNSHHNANPISSRKLYIDKLTGGVTLDLIDSIDFLEILFLDDFILQLPKALENAIIAFACLNFFLPTLALMELNFNKFDGQVRPVSFQVLYSLSYILLVNMPFFIIRLILWFKYNQDVSVFIAKNFIMTLIYFMDIRESLGPSKPRMCQICRKLFIPEYISKHMTECHNNDSLQDQVETDEFKLQQNV